MKNAILIIPIINLPKRYINLYKAYKKSIYSPKMLAKRFEF